MINKELITNPLQTDANNLDIQKQTEFELFTVWLSLPPLMKRPPAQKGGIVPEARAFAESMGIDDEIILDLVELKTQKDFANRYLVDEATLVRWKNKIKTQGLIGITAMQNWAQTMSANVLMSIYQHAMKKGNPLTAKLWFQLVDNWKENVKVEHQFTPVKNIEHDEYDDTI